MRIQFELNGSLVRLEVDATERLIDLLRERLNLTGTKEGCGKGECGACTVLLDDMAVCSCLILAPQVAGRKVTTIEAVDKLPLLRKISEAFAEVGAVQCGFCTPGMIMAAVALLKRNAHPSKSDIRRALAGNLCRCTGYQKIFTAVQTAASASRKRA